MLNISALNITEMTAPQIIVRINNGVGLTAEVSCLCFNLINISTLFIEQIRIRYKVNNVTSDNSSNTITVDDNVT